MAAKERHKQKVKQRLCDKLESICLLEESLNLTIHKYVQQASTRTSDLLALEDTDLFMKEYGSVEQLLDRVNNTCELLYTSAEDMIGQTEIMPASSQAVPTTPEKDVYVNCKLEKPSTPENDSYLKCKTEIASTPENDSYLKCKSEIASTPEMGAYLKCKTEKPSIPVKDIELKQKPNSTMNPLQDDTEEKSVTRPSRAASPQDKMIKQELLAMLDVTKKKKDKADVIPKSLSKQKSEGALKASQIARKTNPPMDAKDKLSRCSSDSSLKHASLQIPKAVKQMMVFKSEHNKGASVRHRVKSEETSARDPSANFQVSSKGLPLKTSSNVSLYASDSSFKTCSGNEDLNEDLNEEDLVNTTAVNDESIQGHSTSNKGDAFENDIPRDIKDILAKNACKSVGSIVEHSPVRDRDSNKDILTNCLATNVVQSEETGQNHQSFDSAYDGIQGTARKMVQTDGLTIKQSCLPPGKITPVIVCDAFSPWCFSVQTNPREVNLLMEQICTHMSHSGLQEPPSPTPSKDRCALPSFRKTSHFIEHTSCHVQKPKEVEVLYVDYGNRERVKYSNLRQLPQQFYTFPMQAICCSLAEVMPSNKYMLWTEEDCMVFKHFVLNQQMNCIQACRCSSPGIPVIVRLITNFPGTPMVVNPISIGAVLVERGTAKFVTTIDQIGHIEKSGEGKEESLILNKDVNGGNLVELQDHEQHRQPPCSDSQTDVNAHGNTSGQCTVKTETIARKPETMMSEMNSGRGWSVENEHKLPKENECDSNITKGGNYDSKSQKGGKCDYTKVKGDGQAGNSDKLYQINEPTNSGDNKRDSNTSKIDDDRSTKAIKAKPDFLITVQHKSEAREASNADKAKDAVITGINKPDDEKQKEQETQAFMESETQSSVATSNLDSENSTDTGFHSSDVTFDLKLNPQGQEVMLSHVHSPTLFYVHTLQVGRTMDRLMKSLNRRFEKMNRRKLTKLSQTFEPSVGDLCCAQFLQDNCFYRASILKVRSDNEVSGTGKFRVHYIDFGDEEWIPKRRLFPLPPQYSSLPPLAVRCKLAYVKPTTTEGSVVDPISGDYKWSECGTKAFIDLMSFEKTLHMQVVEGHLSSSCEGELIGTQDETLGVYLVDTTGEQEVCANLDLIKQGHAILDGLEAVNLNELTTNEELNDELTTNEELNDWNPMEEDYLSKRNTYQLDTEDVEMATVGYKSGTKKGVCRYFSKGAHCWNGENCAYRHVQSDSAVPLEREEVYCADNQVDALPEVNSWVAAKIMTILTPGHFYILLPLGKKSLDETSTASGRDKNADPSCTETLDDLLLALNEEYSKKSPHDRSLQLKAPGEIVVARFSQDRQWYRARVIEVTEEKVKVFFVDFGNTEWLPDEEVAEITPEFLHLPFQALECFLHNVEPAGEENWTQEARKAFRDLVDGKTLVAHIRSRSWNGSLSVDLYDTSEDTDVNVAGKMIEDNHAVISRFNTDSSCNGSVSGQSRQSNSEKSEVIFLPG